MCRTQVNTIKQGDRVLQYYSGYQMCRTQVNMVRTIQLNKVTVYYSTTMDIKCVEHR